LDRIHYNFEFLIFNFEWKNALEPLRADYGTLLDRINRIFWIIFLYLKFPEEILNEQSAAPKRETFVQRNRQDLQDILDIYSFILSVS